MTTNAIQAVRGMNDVLPEAGAAWDHLETTVFDCLRRYGYRPIRMPLVERTELFVRSIGAVTDIVEKEMYTFTDRLNGDSLTLRPEGTASCVRAVLEHNLLYAVPQRLYYAGAMFRHERPQKGRYRQFHQIGVEALGFAGPDIDAELIVMCARIWAALGLSDVSLELNTLGSPEARQRYRARLVAYLEGHEADLDEDARRRLHTNPLRVLDSKNPEMQPLIEAAPRLVDDLDEASLLHFEQIQTVLRQAGIAFRINLRLVRGLDYYNRTVFEWVTGKLGAQSAVCAGGRYDGLVEQLGGKPAPASLFGGHERAPSSAAQTAQARVDSSQGADQRRLSRDSPADAFVESGDGLRGSRLSEHRRVLDQEARNGDDPRGHLHSGLRLLQRQDRHAARGRPT